MALDQNLFAARRLGFGLRLGEDLPAPPREWAMEQVRSIPKLDFYAPNGRGLASQPSAVGNSDPSPLHGQSSDIAAAAWRLLLALPPDAALTDYPEACKLFGDQQKSEDDLEKSHADDREKRWEIAKYQLIPMWGSAMATTLTAVNGPSPVFERFWQFWCNHFVASGVTEHGRTLYSAHIQTIRAAMTGSFENLLFQAVGNPAILYYLDNIYSVGPHSKSAKHGFSTLNENLGRELLELYSVSPAAGYTQADVIETAKILTGWTFAAGYKNAADSWQGLKPGLIFDQTYHEPGARTVMGKTYAAGDNDGRQLKALIADLAVHPSTAKFISTKLAKAFVADDPPQDSIDRIAAAFTATKGDLIAVHSAVIDEALKLGPNYPRFAKPSVWLQQAHRTFGILPTLAAPNGNDLSVGLSAIYIDLGEEFGCPSQPNGWPETEADWLSKAMLDRRVRYANLVALAAPAIKPNEIGDYVDRLAGTDSMLSTLVKRADTAQHAIILLLASPQFLRI